MGRSGTEGYAEKLLALREASSQRQSYAGGQQSTLINMQWRIPQSLGCAR